MPRSAISGREVQEGPSTQQDLSPFFVARSIELYLRPDGRFGFVMPLAALSRQTYKGFRAGDFSSPSEECAVQFNTPWDLYCVDPDPFPVPSSAVFGKRSIKVTRTSLPAGRLVASGRDSTQLAESKPVMNSNGHLYRPTLTASPIRRRTRRTPSDSGMAQRSSHVC